MTALFIPVNDIVFVASGLNRARREYRATSSDYALAEDIEPDPIIATDLQSIHLFVLTNSKTAAGSEALIAAIKTYKPIIVMGEKTFGGASIREYIKLSNGDAVNLVSSIMIAPSGVTWDMNGIKPDIPMASMNVSEAVEYGNAKNDEVFNKALSFIQAPASSIQ